MGSGVMRAPSPRSRAPSVRETCDAVANGSGECPYLNSCYPRRGTKEHEEEIATKGLKGHKNKSQRWRQLLCKRQGFSISSFVAFASFRGYFAFSKLIPSCFFVPLRGSISYDRVIVSLRLRITRATEVQAASSLTFRSLG